MTERREETDPRLMPRMAAALRQFVRNEAVGGVVLLLATVIALVWANSAAAAGYQALWQFRLTAGSGPVSVTETCGLVRVAGISYDKWSGEPVRQRLERRTGVPMYPVPQTYKGMTHGMTELMALTKSHHGNPVAEYCFDFVEVRHPAGEPDLIRPDKPERGKTGKRIDAVPTAAMAVGGWKLRGAKTKKSGRMVVMG